MTGYAGSKSPAFAVGALLALVALAMPSAPAWAEVGPGGLTPGALWVHARLGQPAGSGSGGGPRSGWALRYERLGNVQGCVVVPLGASGAIRPWFGNDGDPVAVRVVIVDRASGAEIGLPGSGCVRPQDLVRIPTTGEVLDALRSQGIPAPVVSLSPGPRGLTGLETWYWFAGAGRVGVGLNLRGFTVEARAKATTYHWSTGDGGSYLTGGKGTATAPAARHVYGRKGSYPVILDMTWAGGYTWSGFGDAGSGTLGPVTVTGAPRTYPVNEVRSVLQ